MAFDSSKNSVQSVLVVAPHPDDETLGCGGTMLRHIAAGDEVHWLIATRSVVTPAVDAREVAMRARTVEDVAKDYGITAVHRLSWPPSTLDAVPLASLVASASAVFERVAPTTVYLPHPADAHSDHSRAFEMCASAAKWFRTPGLRAAYAYETLSETRFGLDAASAFRPDRYVDIGAQVERKLEILRRYETELAAFPFPRSERAVRALAETRGAESGFAAAEAFQVLRIRE